MTNNINRGFTLIETMVAISLLTVAITAPMLLTVQSLATAYYSRDQITAFYLAQEGIEEVHQIRDGQILQIAQNSQSVASGIDIFGSIPFDQDFTIDATESGPDAIKPCDTGPCPLLLTDDTLYGYQTGWKPTNFKRVLRACYVQADGSCTGGPPSTDEMRVIVTVSWQTGTIQTKSFTISEDLYRWIQDSSGASS